MKYHLSISFEDPPTCLPKKNHKNLHRPGIEPGPPAWQASILPLNQRCSQVRVNQNQDTVLPAVVAEWLRRLTRNQFPSGSVGSNPTDCEHFLCQQSIVGSVVECSPATRAARVRFPDDAIFFSSSSYIDQLQVESCPSLPFKIEGFKYAGLAR